MTPLQTLVDDDVLEKYIAKHLNMKYPPNMEGTKLIYNIVKRMDRAAEEAFIREFNFLYMRE